MSEYVTLSREEYDNLQHLAVIAVTYGDTLDMILDVLKEDAFSFDLENVYVHSISSPDKLANIFRYRMPEEWHEVEKEVIEREKRKEEQDAEHRCDD